MQKEEVCRFVDNILLQAIRDSGEGDVFYTKMLKIGYPREQIVDNNKGQTPKQEVFLNRGQTPI